MADSLSERLQSLSVKARMLLHRYEELERSKRDSEAELERLRQTVTSQRREIETLKAKAEQARIASVMATAHADVEQARTFIAGLVRDIDKSIAQLTS